jgi:hypothetical protein
MILLNPEHKEIHSAIGQALDAYASVEGSQVMVLEAILKVSSSEAAIIFFSVQNTRSRCDMFDELLKVKHQSNYTKFWSKCQAFLLKLASYRNAVVHWHPVVALYQDSSGKVVDHAHELSDPWGGGYYHDIRSGDIPAFVEDCRYIEQELHALKRDLSGEPVELASPNRFVQPVIRENLAALRRPQMPKAPQAPRPPSVPKLSRAQKRAKALKDAKFSSLKPKSHK